MNTRKMWDQILKSVKKVGEKTWGYSKIAGTRVVEFEQVTPLLAKKFNINRNMHKHYEQLGNITYEMSKIGRETTSQNPEIKELFHEISALENELERIEGQINQLKGQYDQKVVDLKSENRNFKAFGRK